jgi:hypothetical protein
LFSLAMLALLSSSSTRAAVTTYCCDAAAESAYIADLTALGVPLSTVHEGFDASPWGADTCSFCGGSPAPSVSNLGISWGPLPSTVGGYLATSTGGGNVHDGTFLMYAVDSGGVSHPVPDGFSFSAGGPSLHGVGGWFRSNGSGSKLAFIVDGDPARVDFTGAEASVTTWKFLGFIDTVAFSDVDVRTADEVGNETTIFFADDFTLAQAAAIVNADLNPPPISNQTYDPTPVPEGPAGMFSFIAKFCANSSSPDISAMYSRTERLDHSNSLINRDRDGAGVPPGGVGSELDFPPTLDYADMILAPNECVDVTYEIGLAERRRFSFFVDVYGVVPGVTP